MKKCILFIAVVFAVTLFSCTKESINNEETFQVNPSNNGIPDFEPEEETGGE